MIMTEKEAKTKWCPMVRTGLYGGVSVNRHVTDDAGQKGEIYAETRCLGSGCALWVWFMRDAGDLNADREGSCGLLNRLGAS